MPRHHDVSRRFMHAAIREARRGVLKAQTPFGACIVRGDEVISAAHNAVWKNTDITAHAEIQAIRKACRKLGTVHLSGCVIYSTCEPCPMCFSACHWACLSGVVYGVRISDAARLGFRELRISNKTLRRLSNKPMQIEGNVMREENLQLFTDWMRLGGRKTY